MLTLEPRKHEVVRQYVESHIRDQLAPHDRIPTERTLAQQLGVNRLTVRRALEDLEHEGLIYRVQGAGTFVSDGRIHKSLELTSFSEDMRSRNMRPGSLEVSLATETAGMAAGYALGLSPAQRVVHVRRVRTADDAPLCIEDAYFPEEFVPGLAEGIEGDSLYDELDRRFGLRAHHAEQSIRAVVVDEESASLLAVPAYSPAFLVTRTVFDVRGRAIEYATSQYRGDRYSYDILIARPDRGDRAL